MWQKKRENTYHSVVEQLKKQLFEHTDILIQNGSNHQSDRMGLFDGEASVAFTYWIMYKLTAEESYIVYAKKQCQFVLDNDYQVTSDDLIQESLFCYCLCIRQHRIRCILILLRK